MIDWFSRFVVLFGETYLKSHLKTCQQVRPSPSMDWGQNPLALPSPCTGGRAAPDQIGVVWQMVWMEGGQINYNLIKELWNFWPGDVSEVHGFPNTWSIFFVSFAKMFWIFFTQFLNLFSVGKLVITDWSRHLDKKFLMLYFYKHWSNLSFET